MKAKKPPTDRAETPTARRLFSVACVGLAVTLGWAVLSFPDDSPGLAAAALKQLPDSGVTNPVTAVVLNYRAYDTLIEIGVLLLVVVCLWSMAKVDGSDDGAPRGPMLAGLARVLTPLLLVVAGYFLWVGAFAPGGAFQGGALLGGVAVLLLLAFGPRCQLPKEWLARAGLSVGFAVFTSVAVGVMTEGRQLLEYPKAEASTLLLVIESAAMLSIGLTLAALFLGGRLAGDESATVTTDVCPSERS